MQIRLLYFANVREKLGTGGETLTLSEGAPTLATLRALLLARGGEWENILGDDSAVKFAVNQRFAAMDTPLTDNCEVAIFPPVTGG